MKTLLNKKLADYLFAVITIIFSIKEEDEDTSVFFYQLCNFLFNICNALNFSHG